MNLLVTYDCSTKCLRNRGEVPLTIRVLSKKEPPMVCNIDPGQEITHSETPHSLIEIPATDKSVELLNTLKDMRDEVLNYCFIDDVLLITTKSLYYTCYLIAVSLYDRFVIGYNTYLHPSPSKQMCYESYYSDPAIKLNELEIYHTLNGQKVYYSRSLLSDGYLPYSHPNSGFPIERPFLKTAKVYVKKAQPPSKKVIFNFLKYKANRMHFTDSETGEEHIFGRYDIEDLIKIMDRGKVCVDKYYSITDSTTSFNPVYSGGSDVSNFQSSGVINAEVCSDSDTESDSSSRNTSAQ